MFDWKTDPHRRFNPLTRDWVLVSPHRTDRPWQGQVEDTPPESLPDYDPKCYLCPGNSRAGGARNPAYTSTFVFDNDFAALKPGTATTVANQQDLLIAEAEPGICRVVCFSPRHNLTLANMQHPDVRTVVDTWADQYADLGANPMINYVQIFENRGAMMGCSNPHPHCQIWSSHRLPSEVAKEQESLLAWRSERGTCLVCDYAHLEESTNSRIVDQNEGFLTMVPFWAIWPFEIMVIPRRHVTAIDQITAVECDALADILRRATARYDRLFKVSFPYSMGFHQRPTDSKPHDEWHMHLHFYPPLLRSATVRKFLVGYEMLGMPQRDITPESAAERLRSV
jgi:UDPglucose--hexose-1-phosphate uridylyltransferase